MMRQKFRKSLTLVMAVIMVLTVLAGCGSTPVTPETTAAAAAETTAAATTAAETTAAATTAAETTTAAPAPEEPLEFSLLQEVYNDMQSEIWVNMQKKLNIKINPINCENAYEQKINILYAANDLPDIFETYMLPELRQNAVARIPFDEFFAAAPRSYANNLIVMNELGYNPEKTWKMYMPTDGMIGEIPMVWYGASLGYGITWRLDYLKELGYSEPPTTLEGYTEVFAKYKAKYPDRYAYGTGQSYYRACTIPLGAAGVVISRWMLDGGQLVPGWTKPAAKDALAVLKNWYEKGYLDREFLTKTDDFDGSKSFNNGISIVKGWEGENIYAAIKQIKSGVSPLDSLDKDFYKLNPTAELVMAKWPSLNGAKPAVHAWASFHGNAVGFNRKLESDKERLLKLVAVWDELSLNPENTIYENWGEKGVHWEINAAGDAVAKEPFTGDARTALGAGRHVPKAFSPEEMAPPFYNSLYKDAINEAWIQTSGIYSNENLYRVQNFVSNLVNPDTKEDLNEKYADLMLAPETLFSEIVVGVKPLSAYDDYIKLWNEKGGKEIEALVNKKYLSFYK